MNPTKFPEQNATLAEDQPEYLPLPVYRAPDGLVVSCWTLTLRERLKLLFTGRLWLMQLTFNEPLQPQSPTVSYPFTPQTVPVGSA
jgi:hypothetical protein